MCTEVEVGIGDNQYPMHLSISYKSIEVQRTLGERESCWWTAGVVSGEGPIDSYYSAYNR